MSSSRVFVTGGAGFIGSHLVDELMEHGSDVVVLDNLSSGSLKNIERWLKTRNFMFIEGDLLRTDGLNKAVESCEVIYHLAANPEVRTSTTHPELHYEQNIRGTFNLLEATRKMGNTKMLIFASTSTVYGEASKIPTPEEYGPLKPISIYGSSKLSSEALITGYAHTYGFKATIYRLANILGPRSKHGVVWDFVQKLRKDPRELEVLGDGTQMKSYLFIDDCVRAMQLEQKARSNQVDILNVGSEDQIDVKTIANIVIEELGLEGVKLRFTGGVDGGRGWIGDVRNMLLDTSRIRSRGWRPRYDSEKSIKLTVREILSRGL